MEKKSKEPDVDKHTITSSFDLAKQFVDSFDSRWGKSPEKPFSVYYIPWALEVIREVEGMGDNNGGNIGGIGGNNGAEHERALVQQNNPITFEFPIAHSIEDAPMKNIPHSALPIFRGLTVEDPDMFLFEFDVLCHSYDYQSNS